MTIHELPCAKVVELVTVQRRSEEDLWNAINRIANFAQDQELAITKLTLIASNTQKWVIASLVVGVIPWLALAVAAILQ